MTRFKACAFRGSLQPSSAWTAFSSSEISRTTRPDGGGAFRHEVYDGIQYRGIVYVQLLKLRLEGCIAVRRLAAIEVLGPHVPLEKVAKAAPCGQPFRVAILRNEPCLVAFRKRAVGNEGRLTKAAPAGDFDLSSLLKVAVGRRGHHPFVCLAVGQFPVAYAHYVIEVYHDILNCYVL